MWQEWCFCNFFQNHFFNPTNIISITTFVWQTLHGGDQCVSLDTYLQLLTGIFPTAFKQALNSQVSVVTIQLRLRYSQSLKPCKLQKPIPNHQSSFCWIYLPLLTLSIIRSSCAPSHHWTSLGFHFAGLNPISLVGLSGWPGEGRYLVVFPATPTLQHDFTIQLSSSTIALSTSVRKLGVIFDDQLTFKEHIAKIARSCRFALHNIRKIRPFLTEHAAQLLVQALVISRLDYCNPLLGGLPSNTIKPLFRMQRHDWSSTSPKEPMLHLSLSPCTGYQLLLASSSRHWCLHIEQPQAQHPPTATHYYESTSPPEVWDLLVSNASWYHHREAQNHSPEHSLSPFLAGGMIFPPPSGILDPCQSSISNWKLISFDTTWLHPKLKKIYIYIIFLFMFLSFPC